MKFKVMAWSYCLGAALSWFLISGWSYADLAAQFPSLSMRELAGFSAIWAAGASVEWPLFLPGEYGVSGFAEHGWKPVWDWNK